MMKLSIAIVISLALGFSAALWFQQPDSAQSASGFDDGAIQQRLTALENQLTKEIAARRELEAALDEMVEQPLPLEFAADAPLDDTQEQASDAEGDRREALRERLRSRRDESRQSRLEQAGFAPDQAARIVAREKALRLDNLYERWERRREDYLEDGGWDRDNPLREELGEDGYERYLEAYGRSTRVAVRDVMEQSPAAYAGFQPGDEIVRYNGERVFDVRDLNAATVKGEAGQAVIVDVIRDGVPVQLTIERGPLGIVSRGRRGRR